MRQFYRLMSTRRRVAGRYVEDNQGLTECHTVAKQAIDLPTPQLDERTGDLSAVRQSRRR